MPVNQDFCVPSVLLKTTNENETCSVYQRLNVWCPLFPSASRPVENKLCEGPIPNRSQLCQMACPIDCEVSPWGAWGPCTFENCDDQAGKKGTKSTMWRDRICCCWHHSPARLSDRAQFPITFTQHRPRPHDLFRFNHMFFIFTANLLVSNANGQVNTIQALRFFSFQHLCSKDKQLDVMFLLASDKNDIWWMTT